jgi:hypothetical protein
METGCFYVVRAEKVEVRDSSALEAVKRGPERMKLMNLHC